MAECGADSAVNVGGDKPDYGWSEHLLPCGCKTRLFRTRDERMLPIGMGPYPNLSATVWCPEHGWVKVTDDEFTQVKEVHGGIA